MNGMANEISETSHHLCHTLYICYLECRGVSRALAFWSWPILMKKLQYNDQGAVRSSAGKE